MKIAKIAKNADFFAIFAIFALLGPNCPPPTESQIPVGQKGNSFELGRLPIVIGTATEHISRNFRYFRRKSDQAILVIIRFPYFIIRFPYFVRTWHSYIAY